MAYNMINARVESLLEKKTFSRLVEKKRCLVPMDGFYEWKKEGKAKSPYRIVTKDQEIFTTAGLWETWKNPKGEEVHTFTIITLAANEFMQQIHDRMPAILTKDNEQLWLDEDLGLNSLMDLLLPYPDENMAMYRVTDKVGNVRENNADLIKSITANPTLQQGKLFDD